jgi:D-3-phosphoglycerate dehydrogenase
LHTPYDNTTHNLINKESFLMMKSSAFVINSARGGIINENDLKEVLIQNRIAGAAIDAYVVEPPTDQTLLKCENLICTPHIGGNAEEAVEEMGLSAINHIREFYKV